jgi:hypothetical protein
MDLYAVREYELDTNLNTGSGGIDLAFKRQKVAGFITPQPCKKEGRKWPWNEIHCWKTEPPCPLERVVTLLEGFWFNRHLEL